MKIKNNVSAYARVLIAMMVSVQSLGFSARVYAADTGGYPWADATEINARTYDWGYDYCHPAMAAAQTCSVNYRYQLGVLYRLSDPWRYDLRNCTSFAAWRANQAYGLNLVGWGNANTWGTAGRATGYAVDGSPRIGDIAVWTGGAYGHVAFVYEVNSDGSVNVEQYNKAGRGEFSRQSGVWANEYVHIAPPTAPVVVATPTPASTPAPVVEHVAPAAIPSPVPAETPPQAPAVPEKDVVSYFVEKSEDSGVKTIAVKQNNTKSGKVEVLTAKEKEDDTWSEPTITEVPVKKQKATSIAMGDYNQDGVNDMFEVAYNQTTSGMVEITILDGSTDFKHSIGAIQTKEKQHDDGDVYYDVADRNNDGKIDVLQVWHQHTSSGLVELKIFDGKADFKSNPSVVILPEQAREADDVYFMFGDHDNDTAIDLYEVIHSSAEGSKTMVKVFDIRQTLATPISKWTTESDTYKGRGPNLARK